MRLGYVGVIILNSKIPPCRGFFRTREGNYSTVTFALKHKYVHNYLFKHNKVPDPLLCWDYFDEDYDKRPCEFYAELNDKSGDHIGVSIRYSARPEFSSNDVDQIYSIELTEEEQDDIVRALDQQCVKYYGRSCKDIMKEIRAEVKEYGTFQL